MKIDQAIVVNDRKERAGELAHRRTQARMPHVPRAVDVNGHRANLIGLEVRSRDERFPLLQGPESKRVAAVE